MAMKIGAIFDFDGVIIDSAAQHEESWNLLAREQNLTLPDGHFQLSFGMKNEKIIPEILEWTHDPKEIRRLSLRKEELYRGLLTAGDIVLCDGVLEFLNMCRDLYIPCAIGSSAERQNIEIILDRLELGY